MQTAPGCSQARRPCNPKPFRPANAWGAGTPTEAIPGSLNHHQYDKTLSRPQQMAGSLTRAQCHLAAAATDQQLVPRSWELARGQRSSMQLDQDRQHRYLAAHPATAATAQQAAPAAGSQAGPVLPVALIHELRCHRGAQPRGQDPLDHVCDEIDLAGLPYTTAKSVTSDFMGLQVIVLSQDSCWGGATKCPSHGLIRSCTSIAWQAAANKAFSDSAWLSRPRHLSNALKVPVCEKPY